MLLVAVSVAWFTFLAFIVHDRRLRRFFSDDKAPVRLSALTFMCVLSLVAVLTVTFNAGTAWGDLMTGRAASYRGSWEERDAAAREASNDSRLEFDRLDGVATTVLFSEISNNPTWWPNAEYAEWMGVGAVRLQDGMPWPENPEPVPGVAPLAK
jgi:hypothetical protein